MMVTIKKISINELNKLILLSYRGDFEGLAKYHIQPFYLEDAVECTMSLIRNEAKVLKLTYYQINYQQRPVGYFVIANEILYSFCINKTYRRPKIVLEWWGYVLKLLKTGFCTAVYENNTRALRFLKRRGMKVMNKDDDTGVVTLIKL